jgi:hypothetical protein
MFIANAFVRPPSKARLCDVVRLAQSGSGTMWRAQGSGEVVTM